MLAPPPPAGSPVLGFQRVPEQRNEPEPAWSRRRRTRRVGADAEVARLVRLCRLTVLGERGGGGEGMVWTTLTDPRQRFCVAASSDPGLPARGGMRPRAEGSRWRECESAITEFDPHGVLAEARLGVLATLKADGRPQLSPVTPYYDPAAGALLRFSMTEGRAKTANLRRDPRAALEVTSERRLVVGDRRGHR